jgi:ElaB/YqjD/DUF883 family membrane-anchored ribosome-binding protein
METNMTRETTAEQRPGQQVTGRPESGHGVVDMMETVEQGVKDGMHQAHEAVDDAVRDTGDALSWALDIPGHIARHPWFFVGAAVLVGLLIFGRRR